MKKLLKFFVVLLFAFPKANIYVGPIPVYFIDIISLVMIYRLDYSKLLRPKYRNKIMYLVIFFLLNQLLFLIFSGEVLIVLYNSLRYMIPLLVAVRVYPYLFKCLGNDKAVFHALLFANIFTSVTMILSSLRSTRLYVEPLFSLRFLYPAAERNFDRADSVDGAVRALSLIGVSNIAGTSLLAGLGLLLYFKREHTIRKIYFYPIIFVLLIGALSSYSRIVWSVVFTGLVLTVFISRASFVLKVGLVGLLSLTVINWNSLVSNEVLNVSRIHKTVFQVDEASQNYQHGVEERYNSYFQPFLDVVREPLFLITGLTVNEIKSSSHMPFFRRVNRPDHSLFGRSFYFYGFPSFYIYVTLLVSLIVMLRKSIVNRNIAWSVLIGVIGWCLTDHGMISSPNGALMFFLVASFVHMSNSLKVH